MSSEALPENPADVQAAAGGSLQLRFLDDESRLRSINAAQMAEVLQGLVSLTSDLARGGAFGEGPAPELRVEPPKEGSFILEVFLNWFSALDGSSQVTFVLGSGGILGQALNVGTKSARAEVSGVERLENDKVLLTFNDNTVAEVPEAVWVTLNRAKRKTKANLRKIMAPLGDDADALEISAPETDVEGGAAQAALEVRVDKDDYFAVAHEDEDVVEHVEFFEVEGQLTSIDFDSAEKWRVSTTRGRRSATVEDSAFLDRINKGLALHKDDIFWLKIREEREEKNGRMGPRKWFIEHVEWRRRGGSDDDDAPQPDKP